jgi:hypothetical protein
MFVAENNVHCEESRPAYFQLVWNGPERDDQYSHDRRLASKDLVHDYSHTAGWHAGFDRQPRHLSWNFNCFSLVAADFKTTPHLKALLLVRVSAHLQDGRACVQLRELGDLEAGVKTDKPDRVIREEPPRLRASEPQGEEHFTATWIGA